MMPHPLAAPKPSILRYIASRSLSRQIQLFVLVVLGVAVGLLPIHLFRMILDRAIPHGDRTLVFQISGALLGAVVVAAALAFARTVVADQIRQAFLAGFRNELFAYLLRVSP